MKEDQILAILNRYRNAWSAMNGHDPDVDRLSEVWYTNGWCYIWVAKRGLSGVEKMSIKPWAVRLRQLEMMTRSLEQQYEELQKHERTLATDGDHED